MNTAHRLSDALVLNLDGAEVRLGELWEKRRVVLVFIRHYG